MASADMQQVPEMAPARCTQVRQVGAFPESGGRFDFLELAVCKTSGVGFEGRYEGKSARCKPRVGASRTPMSIK
jgi:hypothetical protein